MAGVCHVMLVSPHAPGAVAVLQLTGDVEPILRRLTTQEPAPIGALRLVNIAGIDDGIVVRVQRDVALLMPHGGLRIIHRIAEAAVALGAVLLQPEAMHPTFLYPEAHDMVEACMLAALARAASPLAIELLLAQPKRWRDAKRLTKEDVARAKRLNRLINPPLVVLAGEPNVGKSTLTNALTGRTVSIATELPGTTRDYTVSRIDIAGVVVDWCDTPGLRHSDDDIEQRAISIASVLLDRAEVIIAMSAPGSGWPVLPREPHVRVMNKSDLLCDDTASGVLRISALTSANLPALAAVVRESLVPQDDLDHPGPWLFDDRLILENYNPVAL